MGFRLPGKSIISGTSAHKSALKMKENSMAKRMEAAAKAMEKDSATKAMAPNKAMESPNKESFSQAYRSNRDAGKKYFTYKGKEYTTESRSEKVKREKTGKTYAELNPKKSRTITSEVKDKPKADDPIAEQIKKSNPKKAEGPREGTKKEKVDVAKKNVKKTKKESKIKTLKAKQELAETKGKSRRAERLKRKIERKETGKTRADQRRERKEKKEAFETLKASAGEAGKKAIEKQKGNSPSGAKAMAPNKAMSPNKAMTPNKAMSPAKKPLVGKQKNLPDHLKKKILEA